MMGQKLTGQAKRDASSMRSGSDYDYMSDQIRFSGPRNSSQINLGSQARRKSPMGQVRNESSPLSLSNKDGNKRPQSQQLSEKLIAEDPDEHLESGFVSDKEIEEEHKVSKTQPHSSLNSSNRLEA